VKNTILTKGIKKFAKQSGLEVDKVVRKIALIAYDGITKRTPVDTGRARANWNFSVGNADTTVSSEGFGKSTGKHVNSPTPPSSPKAPKITLKKGDGLEDIYITNNLPYIKRLEYGHHSKQAPKGMVKVTLAEINNQFR